MILLIVLNINNFFTVEYTLIFNINYSYILFASVISTVLLINILSVFIELTAELTAEITANICTHT